MGIARRDGRGEKGGASLKGLMAELGTNTEEVAEKDILYPIPSVGRPVGLSRAGC